MVSAKTDALAIYKKMQVSSNFFMMVMKVSIVFERTIKIMIFLFVEYKNAQV